MGGSVLAPGGRADEDCGEGTPGELAALLLPSGDNAGSGSTELSAPTLRKDLRLRESRCDGFKDLRILVLMANFSSIWKWNRRRILSLSRAESNRKETQFATLPNQVYIAGRPGNQNGNPD
jgi:hypothetical protein